MSRTTIKATLTAIAATTALTWATVNFLTPAPAYCANCSPAPCQNSSMCYPGCACLKAGQDWLGTCVRIE